MRIIETNNFSFVSIDILKATMYKFQFTSTIEDLLEADEAFRSEVFARPALRQSATFIGVFFIQGSVFTLSGVFSFPEEGFMRISLFLLVIGTIITYYSAVAPWLSRRRIRMNNAATQEVSLIFEDSGVQLDIQGVGSFVRAWGEMKYYVDTSKGIIISSDDGTLNCLPNRVFPDKNEREAFRKYLVINDVLHYEVKLADYISAIFSHGP
ncbi:MAG: hypothetical protein OEZ04_03155 [Nitrospinota bacterium]|nr:hypothetical protein [Nitrospinota bacterium]